MLIKICGVNVEELCADETDTNLTSLDKLNDFLVESVEAVMVCMLKQIQYCSTIMMPIN